MISVKRLLLAIMISSLGSAIYGMEKELLSSELISKPSPDTAFLLSKKAVEYNYEFFRKIDVGSVVLAIAFSPNGKTIVTGSKNGIVRLWDIETGELLKEFQGHTDIIHLWDVENGGKQLKEFKWYNSDINSVEFSPDGKTIISRSSDNTTTVWDLETGEQLKTFKDHTYKAASVACSPDGKTILTGSLDGIAWLWNLETGKQLKKFIGHKDSINSVAFSPDGKTIVTGSKDLLSDLPIDNVNTARLLDAKTGELLKEFKGHTNEITSVAFSKDGGMIATASLDKTVIIYQQLT